AHGTVNPVAAGALDFGDGTKLAAANPGTWARNLAVTIDHKTKDANSPTPDAHLFNITIFDDPATKLDSQKRGGSGVLEPFLNVSVEPASPRYLKKVLEQQSVLVRATTVGAARPGDVSAKAFDATTGDDGGELVDNDVLGDEAGKTGMNALLKADIFN